ncbi:hypothetical protein ABEV74_08085 [Paenibacillus cisolokensis]|uniref:hypothetical protein n=1 Tax=Paenibacillus cisolokensis TaxID=1658519 RepID=UPI003D29E2E2
MGVYGDWIVMVLAGGLIAIWIYRGLYRWLHSPPAARRLVLGEGAEILADDENVQLLERHGYQVISGKHRVPLHIEVDGAPMESRLYIDYIAEQDGKTYIVKTARDRMPIDWTGSGLRDRLLVYALLLPECEGVLYTDAKEGTVRVVTFAWNE